MPRDASTHGAYLRSRNGDPWHNGSGDIVDLRISHAVPTVPPLHNRCAGHCCGRSRRDQSRAKPGERRAVLPRQDHQYLCRLVGRRRLRHLRPAAGAPFRQAHPRAADHRGAEHARRRLNKAASYLFSVAPKDGTAIGAIFPGAILQPLFGDTTVQHEPNKFIYLGSANADVYHCFWRTDAAARSFRDALDKDVILGASNEGGTTRDLPAMMINLAGAKFRIVTGYAGSKEIGLAVERKEVDGACGIGWTGFTTLYPHWFEKKLVAMTLQLSVKGHAELTKMGVPLAAEFARSKEDRQAMELVLSQGMFGRPFVLPPGVPPDAPRRCARRSWRR